MKEKSMTAVKAYEAEGRPRATFYDFLNGRKEKWIGGSPAWRNNNPGNLRPAKAHPGQIGKTGQYIWHTAQDEKVRKDHAERDGKSFDYANPPKGGNPGEDFNCRCWAEPLPENTLKEVFKK